MSKDDVARIGKDLDGGKAGVALVVMLDEAEAVSAKLVELGGTPETHEVTYTNSPGCIRKSAPEKIA